MQEFSHDLKKKLLKAQQNEITEHTVYSKLAAIVKSEQQSTVLERIAGEELRHYEFFRSLTGHDVRPSGSKAFIYVLLARVLGLNFGLKIMEKSEGVAQDTYAKIRAVVPRIDEIIDDEKEHENHLISLINEERLKYVSSVVLGLNDALVELSGALVGFTLALQQTRLIAIVGVITGIAASMSMAASEYLSTRHEEADKDPLRASIYTGCAYLVTVIILVSPYFVFKNAFLCLTLVILLSLLLIVIFNFYIAVAKEADFRRRFLEMAGVGLGVAVINFIIGLVIRSVFRIEI